jgi:hypothetical protein
MDYMLIFTALALLLIALDNLKLDASDRTQPSADTPDLLSRALDFLSRHT